MTSTAKAPANLALIKRLGRTYIAPHKGRLTLAMLCMLVVAGCTAVFAHMIQPLFDDVFVAKKADALYWVAGAMLMVNLVKAIASYAQNFFMEYVGQRMVTDMQRHMYDHLIRQDLAFFQAHSTAALSTRFVFDLHRLRQSISQVIAGVVRDTTMVIGLLANLFLKDATLALLSLVIFPLALWPMRKFGRMTRKYAAGTQENTGDFSRILLESFGHIRQVKTYTMEPYETARAGKSIDVLFDLMIRTARVRSLSSPVMEVIASIVTVGVILYGGYQTFNGNLTAGAFLSFLTSLLLLYRPVKGLTNVNNTLQEGLAAAERAFELLDTKPALKENLSGPDLTVKRGNIVFSNVSFGYTSKEGDQTKQHTIISKLNLTVPAGKTVALVGPSGAGKSTILNLIPRLFDPTSGRVTIDGIDIKEVSTVSLRRNIGLVTQDIAIFDDTIHNNIAYGHPEGIEAATKGEVIAAAKAAAAHEFIQKLPNGYDTLAGEGGSKLSGGQKQRIAIARAILKNAPILLLDEATASLDTESEKKVQEALAGLTRGRTTLVVAHRLGTIRHADCIHVLEKGRIVESGTHEELLKLNGLYAQLYKLQLGG